MQLNYDVDILPKAVRKYTRSDAQDLAAFRDERTADAARRAGPHTVAMLSAAGISLETYSSGAPQGHYPLADKTAREHLRACLMDAITVEDDGRTPIDGEFDLNQFLVTFEAAKPYGALAPLTHPSFAVPTKNEATVYAALSVLAACGYFAGFALLG